MAAPPTAAAMQVPAEHRFPMELRATDTADRCDDGVRAEWSATAAVKVQQQVPIQDGDQPPDRAIRLADVHAWAQARTFTSLAAEAVA
jgi:hypothetical protein